jgi:hypothetical protein
MPQRDERAGRESARLKAGLACRRRMARRVSMNRCFGEANDEAN